jgi:competence protein ComEA
MNAANNPGGTAPAQNQGQPAERRSPWLLLVFGMVCGLLAAGLILLVSSQPRGRAVTLLPPPTAAPIMVYVVGAVQQPGVYRLPVQSRVQDAIQAAGGLAPQANAAGLNLAAFVADGARVVVPAAAPAGGSRGGDDSAGSSNQHAAPPEQAAPTKQAAPQEQAATPEAQFPININTASLVELDTLPGIGPVTAQRIIDYRDANGLFAKIEDIQNVPGIGPKTFDEIKDFITIGP